MRPCVRCCELTFTNDLGLVVVFVGMFSAMRSPGSYIYCLTHFIHTSLIHQLSQSSRLLRKETRRPFKIISYSSVCIKLYRDKLFNAESPADVSPLPQWSEMHCWGFQKQCTWHCVAGALWVNVVEESVWHLSKRPQTISEPLLQSQVKSIYKVLLPNVFVTKCTAEGAPTTERNMTIKGANASQRGWWNRKWWWVAALTHLCGGCWSKFDSQNINPPASRPLWDLMIYQMTSKLQWTTVDPLENLGWIFHGLFLYQIRSCTWTNYTWCHITLYSFR